MRLKIGADTGPPVVGPLCGESVTTMIATAGLRDGTKPDKRRVVVGGASRRWSMSLAAVPVFPGDREAGNLRGGVAVLPVDDFLHDAGERGGRLGADDAAHDLGWD